MFSLTIEVVCNAAKTGSLQIRKASYDNAQSAFFFTSKSAAGCPIMDKAKLEKFFTKFKLIFTIVFACLGFIIAFGGYFLWYGQGGELKHIIVGLAVFIFSAGFFLSIMNGLFIK